MQTIIKIKYLERKIIKKENGNIQLKEYIKIKEIDYIEMRIKYDNNIVVIDSMNNEIVKNKKDQNEK